MLSFINDDDAMEALMTKLCKDEVLLHRLRTALFPETATTTNVVDPTNYMVDMKLPFIKPSALPGSNDSMEEEGAVNEVTASLERREKKRSIKSILNETTITTLPQDLTFINFTGNVPEVQVKRHIPSLLSTVSLPPVGSPESLLVPPMTLLDLNRDGKVVLKDDELITIMIISYTEKLIYLQVYPTETMASVKLKIMDRESIQLPTSLVQFSGRNGITEDHTHVRDCIILWNPILHMSLLDGDGKVVPKDERLFPLYVETLTGDRISVRVHLTESITSVKFKIISKEDIPLEQQHFILLFQEGIVEDNKVVCDYMQSDPIIQFRMSMPDRAIDAVL
jgi:hypothetical protein